MVRQRSRNTLEEVYGTKFDASKSPTNNNSNNNNKNSRDHGYIITSNMPCSTINGPPANSIANSGLGPAALSTSRRKSARPNTKSSSIGNGTKYGAKEEKDDGKKEHNTKLKTSRNSGSFAANEKCQYNFAMSNQFDNKTYRPKNDAHRDLPAPGCDNNLAPHHNHHNHQHHNHHRHHNHDDDKDDDTEEFFELIRQTVEGAIGKSISELLNRNFRELGLKVERFSSELKNTNELLGKIQMDLNDKVVHYGEENSRHFRYLCMKSEYDKMFYQHQSMMAAAVVPSNTSQNTIKHISASKTKNTVVLPKNNKEVDETAPCTCRSNIKGPVIKQKDAHKSSSDEHNLSQKSSEVGMREVLDHIQRFCTQMQMNDKKTERPSGSKGCSTGCGGGVEGAERPGVARLMDTYMQETSVNINQNVLDDDDDDYLAMSSDGMTPRSDDDEQQLQNYGGMTMRTCRTTRDENSGGGGGGGDA